MSVIKTNVDSLPTTKAIFERKNVLIEFGSFSKLVNNY
jgi:hypothetical protein